MPELPEVETTCRGIEPHVKNQTIGSLIIRQRQLRLPIPTTFKRRLLNQTIEAACRRGKYILMTTSAGTVLFHLGMSGSLRIVNADIPPEKHDHVDIILTNRLCLRFNDPRRFGLVTLLSGDPYQHKLLVSLGPEPLSHIFTSKYLYQASQRRSVVIKALIMNSKIVVGVGNIYANEALFAAGIHPQLRANQLTLQNSRALVKHIKNILRRAIKQGGTTLRDFVNSEGKPGYFKQQLAVYGRAGLSCKQCTHPLQEIRIAQRSTVFCPYCQLPLSG
ncbi:MAG: bifunctional DNA-formamidopyrimidine glycosylase/DNA-(apurinic or apyrimidinic site) lyase [Gammaproteobacteria bacterium]|nr:bifunctional DNA-formamidopyrimidine glycosylase/DNA-(apurinic or apyrimidinic site) lyase [Gammaproteobacteria bacterium]